MFGKLFKKKLKFEFNEPENTACLTCFHILEEKSAILYVSHDEDDGGWQFLCGGENHVEDDARMVSLKTIVTLDHSINKLHDMPVGMCSERTSADAEWKFYKK